MAFYALCYVMLLGAALGSLLAEGDLSLGRQPWRNFFHTVKEMSTPSFVDVWLGDQAFEFRNEEGEVLRTENQRLVELEFLQSLFRAAWHTLRIATLGSFLGAILGVVPGFLTARNMQAPRPLALLMKLGLDLSRSIHTLVFGLIFVGIFGLGSMAGILAIAAHSLGSYGKLYAEALEALDMQAIDAVRSVGARPMQVFFAAVVPGVLPQYISINLYIWEFNVRDSTILGLVGAGGIGLLLSEATALFQWGRLTTILLVIVIMVSLFDSISRKIRKDLL
ncbi:phosphonate ABC transporter, permease protein PhnE [Oligoflexus tunisiensis]|uniref:phosphonate ABC transporter, permease protein PhnE n=1 Tax=Oligoflexus tunisiensis TaxID=708132 RepID=UPI001C403F79|nr:phosphonate ABC transporter, permease protein PhnE [Oligoflexus tunisiensis]